MPAASSTPIPTSRWSTSRSRSPRPSTPVQEVQATTVVAVAARVGLTRLIDNIVLGEGVA